MPDEIWHRPSQLRGASMPIQIEHREHLQKILQKVESGTPCTTRDLAREFGLSPSRLQHLFKERTGARLGQWLAELRLQRAARLLAESNMSVKEVANAVGYGHSSSFVRAFERVFHQAPGRFQRKKANQKGIQLTTFA
jgi:AraC-like DNA-binding protein